MKTRTVCKACLLSATGGRGQKCIPFAEAVATVVAEIEKMDPNKYRPRDLFNPAHVTTLAGAPVSDTTNSLTAGTRGPVLLNDFHLVEKLANFDRERIPERVVHARGVTAKGVFTCTRSLSSVTTASVFAKAGETVEVATRFSTVVHSRHSPETLRDPRGYVCFICVLSSRFSCRIRLLTKLFFDILQVCGKVLHEGGES